MRKFLTVDTDRCTGCRLCELACSMAKENTFNPKKSHIRVHMVGFPEVPVPVYTRHCDSCGGKPVCLRYCPVGCISFSADNPKLDNKKIVLAEHVAEEWLEKVGGTKGSKREHKG
ncbi:MAG: 4Fe-4S binding protein [Proteobacteria bacterium]|nr:4Fe-4S binding protein [Pseudomonadota bacterium]